MKKSIMLLMLMFLTGCVGPAYDDGYYYDDGFYPQPSFVRPHRLKEHDGSHHQHHAGTVQRGAHH
ncbi:MAG: hypothetical protein ACHQJ6_08100 [Candidatus Berkiellales bacterium]